MYIYCFFYVSYFFYVKNEIAIFFFSSFFGQARFQEQEFQQQNGLDIYIYGVPIYRALYIYTYIYFLCPLQMARMRLARTQGLRECIAITDACTREALSEASAGCIAAVSNFIGGK